MTDADRPRPQPVRRTRTVRTGRLAALVAALLLVGTLALPALIQAGAARRSSSSWGPLARTTPATGRRRRRSSPRRGGTPRTSSCCSRRGRLVQVERRPWCVDPGVLRARVGVSVALRALDPIKMDGMALDPASGATAAARVLRREHGPDVDPPRPSAAVLLYRLCYASGNTEPGRSEGTTTRRSGALTGSGPGSWRRRRHRRGRGHPGRPATTSTSCSRTTARVGDVP